MSPSPIFFLLKKVYRIAFVFYLMQKQFQSDPSHVVTCSRKEKILLKSC